MSEESTKIVVDLDTVRALTELSKLEREAERAGGKVGSSIRTAVGRGLGAVGLGGAFGAGVQAIRGATESGVGTVLSEAFSPLGKAMEEFFLGDLNENAKASSAAREETIQAFGVQAGMSGVIPPGAKQFFESVRGIHMTQERGRELFELSSDFSGPGFGEITDRILEGLGTLLSEAVDNLADKLMFWK